MLPLNIVFLIDVASKPTYQHTIGSYRAALNGFADVSAFAHVKVNNATKSQLPDIVDFLYDSDVKPLVSDGETAPFTFTQFKDVFTTANFDLLHGNPYTLFVNRDAPVSPKDANFKDHLIQSMNVLATNKDIMTVSIVPLGTGGETFTKIETAPMRSTIMRTRDWYLTAKLTYINQQQIGTSIYDAAFNNILQTLSQHPYKNLALNPSLVSLT